MRITAAADSSIWSGLAVFTTALAGLIAALAAFVAAFKKSNREAAHQTEFPTDDAERSRLWLEMLERLDAAEEGRTHAERRLEECNRERLELLRQRARRRQ